MDKGVDTRLLVFEELLAAAPPRRLEPVVVPLALRPAVFEFARALACVEDPAARAEDVLFGLLVFWWDVTETSDSAGDGIRSFLFNCQSHCTKCRKGKKYRLFTSAES